MFLPVYSSMLVSLLIVYQSLSNVVTALLTELLTLLLSYYNTYWIKVMAQLIVVITLNFIVSIASYNVIEFICMPLN